MEVTLLGVVERLMEVVKKARLFRRNKVPLRHKVRACILYMAGLSTREIAYTVQAVPASREAVRQWVARLATLSKALEPKARVIVAIDETKMKLNGKPLYV